MIEKPPAFLLYARNWLCSPTITKMSGDQAKAYQYLLCCAWLEEPIATLPDDDKSLAALARVSLQQWNEIKPLILSKFPSDGNGRLFSHRQMQYWIKLQAYKRNGSKGGSKTQANRKQKHKQTE